MLGALHVTLLTLLIPRLGLTTTTMIVVLSQLVGSLGIDHWGWLGVPPQPIGRRAGWWRCAAAMAAARCAAPAMSDTRGSVRVGMAFAFFAVIGAVEGSLGVLLPSLLHTFHLSTASVTLLLLSQIGGSVVASLLSGTLSQRLGLGRMLPLALLLLFSALVLYAVTPGWSLMVGAGMAVGMGIGLVDAASTAPWLSRKPPPR